MAGLRRGLIAGLRFLIRWSGRLGVSALSVAVLLAPLSSCVFIPGTSDHIPLDPLLPHAGWWLLAALGVVLALLAYGLALWGAHSALRFVWQRPLDGAGVLAVLACLPLFVVGVIDSGRLIGWWNAQRTVTSTEHRSLVLASYTTQSTTKTGTTLRSWVDLTHPLMPQAALAPRLPLTLADWQVPAGVRTPGQLACLTVHTGRLGLRWLAPPRPCPPAPGPVPMPELGLVMLQPKLLHRASSQTTEGFFDARGQAWWVDQAWPPTLRPAVGAGASRPEAACRLLGQPRLSSDQRSVVSVVHLGRAGEAAPALPHWEQLGRNVFVQQVDANGRCQTTASLLEPGWVIDADFDSASGRLAVLSARQTAPAALTHQVTIHALSPDGPTRVLHTSALAPLPMWTPFPDQARLRWHAGGLELRHRQRSVPARTLLPSTRAAEVASSPDEPSPPSIGPVGPEAWALTAQASQAPVAVYTNARWDGALLRHRTQGVWYHLAPIVPVAGSPEANDLSAQVDFSDATLSLSPDGHQLIACRPLHLFGPTRCALLALPWPDTAPPKTTGRPDDSGAARAVSARG